MENIEKQLSTIEQNLVLLLERQTDIKLKVDKLEKVVTGNGEVEKGILFRLSGVESHVDFVHRFGWLILGASVSIPPVVLTAVILKILHLAQPGV